MDWDRAIERNREALKRVLAALVAMAGLGGGQSAIGNRQSEQPAPTADCQLPIADTLPRHLHRAVLRLLRPAEAAARRLVIVAARGLVVTLPPPRPRKQDPKGAHAALRSLGIAVVMPHNSPHPGARGRTRPRRTPARAKITLPLLDPLRIPRPGRPRYVPAHAAPRILSFGGRAPHRLPPPPSPRDPIDATRLSLRLEALASVLDDLPKHAKRFARWKARRDAALYPPPCGEGRGASRVSGNAERGGGIGSSPPPRLASLRSASAARRPSPQGGRWTGRRRSPLKPGRPPGAPRRPTHEVHEILADLHYFARQALEQPDTS